MKGKIIIDSKRCKGCEYCVLTCPKGVISLSDSLNSMGYFFAEVTEPEKCTGCALCAEICPDVAIEVWREEKTTKV
ncbi:MAG: 4Fe-4S dicluster domain-containing protein [Nitrospirae bacterium]|nr:MAG: 4Fe-4S dicluster domain-containing protein [Nitrospirota bacterium]